MKDLKDPKFWASVCAWLVPISIFILWGVGISKSWTVSEIGTIIAAIAGPFAGLAGFLYIYASFKVQSKSLKHQKKQIREQRIQFERQSFELLLLRLLDHFKEESSKNFPTDPSQGLLPRVKNLKSKIDFIFHQDENPDLTKISSIFKEVFDTNGSSKIRTMLELVKLLVRILIYIDQSKMVSKDLYFDLLFGQLTEAEIRAYFYGYFYEGFKLTHEEKIAYRKFFIRYNGRDLINEAHINWMKSE